MTLEAMELLVTERGRELLRGVVQLAWTRRRGEVRLAEVTGADGVPRARAERGHARTVVTRLGEVMVRRIGYRSGVKGAGSLFPRDAVLNLPPCGYSWALQRLAEMFCRSGSYRAGTRVRAGRDRGQHRQAAAGADHRGGGRGCGAVLPGPGPGPGRRPGDRSRRTGSLPPLAISADGKGVAMRPEARRRRARPRAAGAELRQAAPGPGRRGPQADGRDRVRLRRPPSRTGRRGPRSRSCARTRPAAPDAPRAVNRWYTCDITAGRAVTIGKIFDEADRRDPGHAADLDRPGRRRQPPDRPDPGPGRRPRRHRSRS